MKSIILRYVHCIVQYMHNVFLCLVVQANSKSIRQWLVSLVLLSFRYYTGTTSF